MESRDSKDVLTSGALFDYFIREEEQFASRTKPVSHSSFVVNDGPLWGDESSDQTYLAVVWQTGLLGAAIYNVRTCSVDLLMDVQDQAPTFDILRSLIELVKPHCIVTSQCSDDRLKEFLAKSCKNQTDTDSGTYHVKNEVEHPTCSQLYLYPGREFGKGYSVTSAYKGSDIYSCGTHRFKMNLLPLVVLAYGPAKQRIGRVRLPSMPEHIQDSDAICLHLAGIINFNRFAMIRAFGGLLTFMDRVPSAARGERDGIVSIITIKMFTMEDDVSVDQNSLNAIRVFHSNSHPSVYKAGKAGKEGFSLFSLFNHCRSAIGRKMLRQWFSRPTRNVDILRGRHRAIQFFMNNQNEPAKVELEKIVGGLKDVTSALGRMAKGVSTLGDWMALRKTSLGGFMIAKLIEREDFPLDIEIFGKIKDTFSTDLARIAKLINDVVDFEASELEECIVVKPGIVEDLDNMKRRLHNLNERLTDIAAAELARMNGIAEEIRVTYIPNMGYLLVLDKDRPNREENSTSDYSVSGLEFVFRAKSGLFYKSDKMRELDQDDVNFGDLTPKIHDCERAILTQLQNLVVRYAGSFTAVLSGAAELDCLISIASTAVNRNYTIPELGEGLGILIENGRHPLQELCVTTFVPNSTNLDCTDGRVSVVSGPNMSGKSVYLKQVAAVVFLAHVGCPVPADSARIQLVDKIFTRLLSEETVALRQSAFLIDLTQVGMAANYATEKSLIVLDEFGKGTRSSDGLALLASVLNYFITGEFRRSSGTVDNGEIPCGQPNSLQSPITPCPFILLATHFHSLPELIPASKLVRYLTLDHIQSDQENLVFLYKIKEGVSPCSYAVETSRAAGFMETTINRIVQITNGLKHNQPIEPLAKLRVAGFSILAEPLLQNLLSYDPEQQDVRVLLDQTLEMVHRGF